MTRDAALLSGLGAAIALASFVALFLGETPIAPARVMAGAFGSGERVDAMIVQSIRLPRILAALLVGAALGGAGAGLQGLLRNPLAEPGVLGVSATASLFAAGIIYGAGAGAALVPVAAIAGALIATAIIAAAALWTRSVATLILIGVGLSSFAGAALSLLLNLSPNPFTLADLMNWLLGSLANRSWVDLQLAGPFILAGLGALFASRRGLTALSLGEETAQGLGLDLARQRLITVAGAGLAAGGAVALAGAIGFVGIIAPHVVRPFFDHDPGRVMAPAALFGALLVLLADIAIRILPFTNELRLGVVAALFGAPLFVWIAIRARAA